MSFDEQYPADECALCRECEQERIRLTERLAAAEARCAEYDRVETSYVKHCTELSKEIGELRKRLFAAEAAEIEAAKMLYFGFMICESRDGMAEVRIKFADLKYAQRLHSVLVKIQNKQDDEVAAKAAGGGE